MSKAKKPDVVALGIAAYNAGKFADALKHFEKAPQDERVKVFIEACKQSLANPPEKKKAAPKSAEKIDLYVVGLGIPELRTATVEAWTAMQSCRALYVNDPKTEPLASACKDVRPIGTLGSGKNSDAREELVNRVVAEAKKGGPVGLAIYGHPLIYEPLTMDLLEAGLKAGLKCRAIAGVSSFDALLSALNICVRRAVGVQISDEEHFLASPPPPPKTLAVVYRVFYDPARIGAIADHCAKAYPPGHKVALVECENWERPLKITWLAYESLPPEAGRHSIYTTLVIPPAA